MKDIIQTTEYKTCSKCETVKESIEFYKHGSSKDGLNGQCKKCLANRKKKYYQENREKFLEIRKQYRNENPKKIKNHRQEYYKENREDLIEYQKQYRQENSKKIKYMARQYRHKNHEYLLELERKYRKTEAGKAVSLKSSHKRRALQAGATIKDFTAQEVFIRDRYTCQTCGIKTRPDYKNPNHLKRPNLDHIIPLSMGGEHSRENTQCLCHKCNMEKGNRHANDQMLLIG